jgi:hypothetical protein
MHYKDMQLVYILYYTDDSTYNLHCCTNNIILANLRVLTRWSPQQCSILVDLLGIAVIGIRFNIGRGDMPWCKEMTQQLHGSGCKVASTLEAM